MPVTKGAIHTYGGATTKAADAPFDIEASYSVGLNRVLLLFMTVADPDLAIVEDISVTANIAGTIGKHFFTNIENEQLGNLVAAIAIPDEETENVTFTLTPSCDDPTGKLLRVNYNTITIIGTRAEDAELLTLYGEAFQGLSTDPLDVNVGASTVNDMLVAVGGASAHDVYENFINDAAPTTVLEVEGVSVDFPSAVLAFQAPVTNGTLGAVEYRGNTDTSDLWPHTLMVFLFRAFVAGEGPPPAGASATSFNCDCDCGPAVKTLAAYRRDLLIRCGFAAVASNPPPGTAELMDAFLKDAQNFLYYKYPALHTRRFFRWTMVPNIRFYGMLNNDDSTLPRIPVVFAAPSANVLEVTWNGYAAPANGTPIFFTAPEDGALPYGILPDTLYYVIAGANGVSNIALTPGGTAITVTLGDDAAGTSHGYAEIREKIFDLSPYKEVEGAWLVDLNGSWLPMKFGIPPAFYTTVTQPGLPVRLEIRSCIEVFPAPSAAYSLYIKGHFGLRQFELDGDKPTIDGHLVYLWALANALDYYGKPSAAGIATQAQDYLGQLVAGTHTGKRYVPGMRPLPPAIIPIFAPWPGGDP